MLKIGDHVRIGLHPDSAVYNLYNDKTATVTNVRSDSGFTDYQVLDDDTGLFLWLNGPELTKIDPPAPLTVGTPVRVSLPASDPSYTRFHGKVGAIKEVRSEYNAYLVDVGDREIQVERHELTALPVPETTTETETETDPNWHVHYTIDLDEREYVRLLQLVLLHGLDHFSAKTLKVIASAKGEWL